MAGISGFADGLTLNDDTLGTVTSITGTAPITVTPSPLTTTGVISFTTPGADTQVMFNDATALAGDAGLTYSKTTDVLSATGGYNISTDVLLRRKAAAALQLGADAAAPTAQTLAAANVAAGTSDTGGQTWTFAGSQSRGNAAGGGFLFRTARAGAAGSTLNSLVDMLTVSPGGATGNGWRVDANNTPSMFPTGSGADIDAVFSSKGTGSLFLATNGTNNNQVRITNTASANRTLNLTGSNGGNPTISTSAGNINVVPAQVVFASGTATPAGGTTGTGIAFGTTANLGVFFGSGAPTLSAAKGSIYIRTDGSGTNDRCYVNTDAGTTWTAIVTVA